MLQRYRALLLPTAALIVIATLAAMIVVPFLLSAEREDNRRLLVDDLEPLEFALGDVDSELLTTALAGAATLEGGEAEQQAYQEERERIDASLAAVRDHAAALDSDDRAAVDEAADAVQAYIDEVADPVAELAAEGQTAEAQELQAGATELFFSADEELDEARDEVQVEIEALLDDNRELDDLGQALTIGLGVLAGLSAAIVIYLAWSSGRSYRNALASEAGALEAQMVAEESETRAEDARRVATTNQNLAMELQRRAEEATRREGEARLLAEEAAREAEGLRKGEEQARREAEASAARAEQARVVAEQARALSRDAQDRAELSAAEALIERGRLDAVFESMADGVAIFDKSAMPIRVNVAGQRMWGLPEADIKQLAPEEVTRPGRLLNEEGEEVGLEGLPSTIAISEDREVREMVFVLEKGEEKMDILASAAPLHGPGGEVVGAVAVWHDVTEIRSVERLKDEFLSFAAHELRTPLTIVKGYASALSRQLDAADKKEMARSIEEESDRIGNLISQLLDVSRIEGGRVALSPQNVRLAELVEEVVERHRDIDPDRVIAFDVEKGDYTCLADSEALTQVLDNLLSNARKYSKHGTPIQIDVESDGEVVRIAVRDQGVGVPRSELDRLGEKLFRASTSEGREGSGLGLYITRHYLEQQGGRLEVESEPGDGSTFTAVVPCAPDEEDAVTGEEATTAAT